MYQTQTNKHTPNQPGDVVMSTHEILSVMTAVCGILILLMVARALKSVTDRCAFLPVNIRIFLDKFILFSIFAGVYGICYYGSRVLHFFIVVMMARVIAEYGYLHTVHDYKVPDVICTEPLDKLADDDDTVKVVERLDVLPSRSGGSEPEVEEMLRKFGVRRRKIDDPVNPLVVTDLDQYDRTVRGVADVISRQLGDDEGCDVGQNDDDDYATDDDLPELVDGNGPLDEDDIPELIAGDTLPEEDDDPDEWEISKAVIRPGYAVSTIGVVPVVPYISAIGRLEPTGVGLPFEPIPSSEDYGMLRMRGKLAGRCVNYVGKVFLGVKKPKHVGYGVFIGVFFVTLTSQTNGGNIVVVAPTVTVNPYRWKSCDGFDLYYTGIPSRMKPTVYNKLCAMVGACTVGHLELEEGDVVTMTHFSMLEVNVADSGHVYSIGEASVSLTELAPGLPLFSDVVHVRGLRIGEPQLGGGEFTLFTENVQKLFELRDPQIILSQVVGMDKMFG